MLFSHLQKFNVESWSNDLCGQFYNGDSYIILSVRNYTCAIIISKLIHVLIWACNIFVTPIDGKIKNNLRERWSLCR